MAPRAQHPEWVAHSSPSRGRPLVPRVERAAVRLRAVAADLQGAAKVPFRALYEPTRRGLGFTVRAEDTDRRAAWAILGEWLVAASVGSSCASEGLLAAHEWFWTGSDRTLGSAPSTVPDLGLSGPHEIRALMPYLLDTMAAATRRDVLRAPDAAGDRHRRKTSGVFYTPGDVAQLMVDRVLAAGGPAGGARYLDPAHGSGVFLRAILSATADDESARQRIYGIDIDPMAAETASFVLTAEDIALRPTGAPPWHRWHQFRRNLATGDALLLDAKGREQQMAAPGEDAPLGARDPWRIPDVFPEIPDGKFARIVANPPFAPLRPSVASRHLAALRPVTGMRAARDISPSFVELCLDLLHGNGAMAVVMPLSVVASQRAPYPDLRERLVTEPGKLEFNSFDRVPDALFGDDVKTRNAIIYLDKVARPDLLSSPLYRWTSRSRSTALASVPTVSIQGLPDVPQLMPKIGTTWERRLLQACMKRGSTLSHWVSAQRSLPLGAVSLVRDEEAAAVIAIAPTAYNFLGVVRDPARAVTDGHDSSNGFLQLTFASETHASAAYALLSSRLAFWMWNVLGDGFHVTGELVRRLPVPVCDAASVVRLAVLGDRLWKAALEHPKASTNSGRTSISYPAWMHTELIDAIDAECAAFMNFEFGNSLSKWYERLVIVDVNSERRNLLKRKMK